VCNVKNTLFLSLLLFASTESISQQSRSPEIRSVERELVSSGFVGTSSVEFAEVSRAGKTVGCSLVYKVIFPDVVYESGNLNVAVGNITFNSFGQNAFGFSLKVGVRPLLDADAPFNPPNFAYIVTSKGSTAKVEQKSVLSDDGFNLFAYSFTDPMMSRIVNGVLNDEVIQIAFNRKANGLDQRFDVDLRVESSELVDGKLQRIRSPKSMINFIDCLAPLMRSSAE
jgi:hypothetical protein